MHFECSKVKFPTEEIALKYLHKIKSTSKRFKIPKRVYLCEHCLSWHLTSSNKNELTWREKYNKEINKRGELIEKLNLIISEKNKEIKELNKKLKKYERNK
jgi:polysaccharide pyruvyl transferase WcaK-like protein